MAEVLSRGYFQQKCASFLSPSFYHFKKATTTLQSASHPAIDELFWTYETLFNKIDMLKATFSLEK